MQTKPATNPAPELARVQSGLRLTPLARAAFDNGVAFDDVKAYCEAQHVSDQELAAAWYEAVNLPANDVTTPALAAHVTKMVTDTLLEGALLRSVLAIGTVEHARLWWRGVL